MFTNTSATLYKYNKTNGGYDKKSISSCFWSDSKISNVLKTGQQTADTTMIYIPKSVISNGNVPENASKDMLVKGDCTFSFVNTSSATISASMTAFRNANSYVTVMSIDSKLYGSKPLQHMQISAK